MTEFYDLVETVTDPNGLRWLAGGPSTDDHLTHGGHETALLQIAKSLLPEGGTFLDIGAHVGLYSFNMMDKANHVIAVEANPRTFERLKANWSLNADSDRFKAVFTPLNVAAWNGNETLYMADENDKETGGSTHVVDQQTEIETRGVPLDETLMFLDRLDLVKIDVEGAEARVLEGMHALLSLHRPALFIEMHDKVYGIPEVRDQVLDILNSHGYQWDDSLTHGPECYYIVAQWGVQDAPVEVVRAGEQPVEDREAVRGVKRLIREDKRGQAKSLREAFDEGVQAAQDEDCCGCNLSEVENPYGN